MGQDGRTGRFEKAAQLIKAGVGVMGADRLLAMCEADAELALVLVPLPGTPREGDRIRVALPSGERSLLVEGVEAAGALRTGDAQKARWAIVGRPVESGKRDDVATSAPVRRSR